KIEIDFDANLDEEFNVPTNKQRVDLSERIWEILEERGLEKAITQLRQEFKKKKAEIAADADTKKDEPRPSETAMENAAEMEPRPTTEADVARRERADRRLRQEAEKRAVDTGKPVEEAKQEVEAEYGGKMYHLAKENVPGGVFFRV